MQPTHLQPCKLQLETCPISRRIWSEIKEGCLSDGRTQHMCMLIGMSQQHQGMMMGEGEEEREALSHSPWHVH